MCVAEIWTRLVDLEVQKEHEGSPIFASAGNSKLEFLTKGEFVAPTQANESYEFQISKEPTRLSTKEFDC